MNHLKNKLDVKPLHWSTIMVLYASVTYFSIFILGSFSLNDTFAAAIFDIVMNAWGVVSVCGMLKLKKWGLVSYLIFRIVVLILSSISWLIDGGTDPFKDMAYFALILFVFLIPKDGHNTYEVLWKNGNI